MSIEKHSCKLQSGDSIGIVTPSSPMFPGRLEKGIQFIEKLGLKAKVGQHVHDSDRFLAGKDEDRARDLMHFFMDDDVKLIIASGGGYGSQRLLPYLDVDIIAANPKPIVGFSDTTAIQLGLYAKTGLVSYSGFVFNCLDDGDLDKMLHDTLLSCLLGKPYQINEGKLLQGGKAKGKLIAGNMDCLLHLIGTEYQPDFSNTILLIEEVRTEPYKLDNMMLHLYQSGILNQVSGLIFGVFKDCDANYFPERDGTSDDVILDWANRINVPCIKDFPYGHIDRRCVVPIGSEVTLDADATSLSCNG